jgi:hypothetical protein
MLRGRSFVLATSSLFGISALALASVSYGSSSTHRYINTEYGFSVQVSPNQPTCRAESGTHDTGIMIFLDHGPSTCVNQNQRPYVAVNGTYNATFAATPVEALSILCRGSKPEPTDPTMFGNLKKRWPAMCRIDQDGFVEYMLLHQSDTLASDTAPSINYTIDIHVPASSLSRDLEDAKPILQSVHMLKSSG